VGDGGAVEEGVGRVGGEVDRDRDRAGRHPSGDFALRHDGRAAKEIVDRCVREAESRIADARVTDFAPIFFGRHARRLIRQATADGPTPPQTA